MKTETKEKLSGDAYATIDNSADVTLIATKLKNVFGQTIVCSADHSEETYIFITNELILKSNKIKS